jgi:hypothetical protein
MNDNIPRPDGQMEGEDALRELEGAVDTAVRGLVNTVISAGWPPALAYAAIKSATLHQAVAFQEHPAEYPREGRKPSSFPLAPF